MAQPGAGSVHNPTQNTIGHALLIGLLCLYALPEILLFLLGLLGGDLPFLRGKMYQNFAFWAGLLGDWRPNYPGQTIAMFFTYGFVHTGMLHLGMNALTLWGLGRTLLEDVSPRRFIAIYCAGVLGGAVGHAVLTTRPFPMVGASGALFALAGAVIWLRTTERDASEPDPTWRDYIRDLIWPLTALTFINVVMYYALDGGLAWEAHLGGFVAGMATMAALPRQNS